LATTSGVPTDATALARVVADLPAPPFFLKGAPRPTWGVEVRPGCTGPVLEVGTLAPGTLVYCVATDASQAWVTVVTLSDTFGAPRIPATEQFVGVVRAPKEEAPAQPPPTMWDDGTPAER
jgi:hypothetical protein